MRSRGIFWICLLTFVCTGCGAQPISQSTEVPSQDPPTTRPESLPDDVVGFDPTQESTEMTPFPPAAKFVPLVVQDLAKRLGIDAARISLVKAAEMLWPTSALGCPRPGVFYPTGRVPGFQIWLEVEGTEYIYNTDLNGKVILCPELNPHIPNPNTDPTPGVPIR